MRTSVFQLGSKKKVQIGPKKEGGNSETVKKGKDANTSIKCLGCMKASTGFNLLFWLLILQMVVFVAAAILSILFVTKSINFDWLPIQAYWKDYRLPFLIFGVVWFVGAFMLICVLRQLTIWRSHLDSEVTRSLIVRASNLYLVIQLIVILGGIAGTSLVVGTTYFSIAMVIEFVVVQVILFFVGVYVKLVA